MLQWPPCMLHCRALTVILCKLQDGEVVVSSTYRRFERDMADLMRVLRGTPAQILWRSYAPTHFGGESGAYVSGEDYEVRDIGCPSAMPPYPQRLKGQQKSLCKCKQAEHPFEVRCVCLERRRVASLPPLEKSGMTSGWLST